MDLLRRNNVRLSGREDGQPVFFAHGFGCDHLMWRYMLPAFEANYRVVLYSNIGTGKSDSSSFNPRRYADLSAYGEDLLEVIEYLDMEEVIFVGHSVSAMIGLLAANKDPRRFAHLVMIGPSPRYVNDPETGYVGGFSPADIEDLLASLESNYLGWSSALAPTIMGNPERPELGEELVKHFCQQDPDLAYHFAKVTFTADNRDDLHDCTLPVLVVQCKEDIIAPLEVGQYVHQQLTNSHFALLDARGHCPNLSAPEATTRAIKAYLAQVA